VSEYPKSDFVRVVIDSDIRDFVNFKDIISAGLTYAQVIIIMILALS
jgi:hypothetical protein